MSLGDTDHIAHLLDRQSDFGQLTSAYERTRPGFHSIAEHPELFQAILHKAFEGRVRFEEYFGEHGILGSEGLATFDTPTQRLYTQKVADQSYNLGLAVEFDTATAANALAQADALPTAINVSVESALSMKFWTKMLPHLGRYNPQDIIFEILEHPVSHKAVISPLQKLKSAGYGFALDDFDIGKDHEDRLKVFGPVVDIVKINGSLVRDCLENKDGKNEETLQRLIRHIREELKPYNSSVIVLAEHVDNFTEAQFLYSLGIDAVQGRNLTRTDYEIQVRGRPVDDSLDINLARASSVDLEL